MIYKMFLFKNRLPLLNRGLDTYALREKTIAKNIANATSPHYRPERVKFEEFFNENEVAVKGANTNEMHIPIGKPDPNSIEPENTQAELPKPEIYFSGESHVNLDKEMAELAKNQIRFRFASRMVKRFFTGLNSAINGMRE
ncbi:MAG: flagellar basal body rod protein FlgB [Candidatus Kapabacteria bacterium]|nr:flagellar basal body rod protein FlgB [Candidatus Kapabacteria bacterium]